MSLPLHKEVANMMRALAHYERMQDDECDDGFGSVIKNKCAACGYKTMQVVRPGKFQCGLCDGEGLS